MNLENFKATLSRETPPDVTSALKALWHDGRGNWTAGHDELQNDMTREGAWVHAYLHRKEGDLSNAAYWYRRAGKPTASGSLETEWVEITETLLGE